MSDKKHTNSSNSLTADMILPIILTMEETEMKTLFEALVNRLFPWPEEKLLQIHKEVKEGKTMTEKQFREKFAKYLSQ